MNAFGLVVKENRRKQFTGYLCIKNNKLNYQIRNAKVALWKWN